jgi:hypothetical protein
MSQRAYYNEWNKDAAAWLRELIAAGPLFDGDKTCGICHLV